ncbi:MAG: cation diffusion facilitator family transporter [Gammaproteobacteria bacterium]|nr:cation diffusion facilitator family transporter [Gammaproteobacteria bacterium]
MRATRSVVCSSKSVRGVQIAGSSKKAIYAALVGNSLIAVTKFIAATLSGSSAMLSEGIHSLVDTGNQLLLLYGLKRAEKPPSPEFPFGHGKEVYFWSFVVAMLIFGLGASVSIYQGWQHLIHPQEITNIGINYAVLGFAVVFESVALAVAFREFRAHVRAQDPEMGYFEAVKQGKDPSIFVVVFEDSAALLGLVIAICGLLLYQITGLPQFDAAASIVIGVVLAATAWWLAYESKGLLIGESAHPRLVQKIREIVGAHQHILHINELATLHMGPTRIIVTLSVDFVDGIDSATVENTVTRLNRAVKALDDSIHRVFVEAEHRVDHHPGHRPEAGT